MAPARQQQGVEAGQRHERVGWGGFTPLIKKDLGQGRRVLKKELQEELQALKGDLEVELRVY